MDSLDVLHDSGSIHAMNDFFLAISLHFGKNRLPREFPASPRLLFFVLRVELAAVFAWLVFGEAGGRGTADGIIIEGPTRFPESEFFLGGRVEKRSRRSGEEGRSGG